MHAAMAFLAILLLLLLPFLATAMPTPSNYISRTAEQQILATVPPARAADDQSTLPFLVSPSGTYAAYLCRAEGSLGGPGGDACYVLIQEAGGGKSVWESECTSVGGADTCDLAFSPMGLELFAGGHSLWDTGIDGEPGTLSLDDGGDMQIVGKDGVTVWKASSEPWSGQECVAAMPASPPPTDALPPPSLHSAMLVSPPPTNVVPPPSPDSEMPVLPPPTDALSPPSPDSALPVVPPPTLTGPGSTGTAVGDQPSPVPPADTVPDSPDQPVYPAPPVAPALGPPADAPPLAPPTGGGETSLGAPLAPVLTPPGEPGGLALPPRPAGLPHGPPHHPFGVSSPPLSATLAPSGHGAGLPLVQGQQQGQGAFGQQQLYNGGGQPLVDSSGGGGWSRARHGVGVSASLAFFGLMAAGFGL